MLQLDQLPLSQPAIGPISPNHLTHAADPELMRLGPLFSRHSSVRTGRHLGMPSEIALYLRVQDSHVDCKTPH
jgi:hypothetical protein